MVQVKAVDCQEGVGTFALLNTSLDPSFPWAYKSI